MKFKNVYVYEDLAGRDFSETGLYNTTFVNCNMVGIKLPTSLSEFVNTKFVDCTFERNDDLQAIPFYDAKYRLVYCMKNDPNVGGKPLSFISSGDLRQPLDPYAISKVYYDETRWVRGYKILKVLNDRGDASYVLGELLIKWNTPMSVFKDCVCRAERAYVNWISDPNGNPYDKAFSCHPINKLIYEVGKEVVAENWDPDIMYEHAGGIRFFLTIHEAWGYCLR